MTQLFETTAGAWPHAGGNANLLPVVANGQLFVASHQQLQIFGLTVGTTTVLSSSSNPSVQGEPVLFSATVCFQSGVETPTGKIEYLNGTTVLTTATLTSGSAKYTTSKLPPGSNSITAVYEADSKNNASAHHCRSINSCGQRHKNAHVFTKSVSPPDGETITFTQGVRELEQEH